MPPANTYSGLIDCHVHATAVTADLAALQEWSPTYVAFGPAKLMGEMLDRGFTTVRDAAGSGLRRPRCTGRGPVCGAPRCCSAARR